jgi:DnaD/phage-associated family protein
MTKKNWISVKRGLSEDPKHRQAMGEAVWLFLHIIDAADWEKGIVYDWRDKDIGSDMCLNQRTVRDWRDRLSNKGYITCKQRQRGLDIIIHNWIDPRNYSGKTMNVRQGDMVVSLPGEKEFEGDTQVDTRVDTQDDTQGIQDSTCKTASFIESTSTSTPTSESTTTRENSAKVFRAYEAEIGLLTPRISDAIGDYLDDLHVPAEWIIDAIHLAATNNKRNWAYCAAILKRWSVEGKTALPPKQQPTKLKGDRSDFLKALEAA